MDFIGARVDRIESEFAVGARTSGTFGWLANFFQLD
jgi:hypothetical protein